jgi:hypothetical protein
VPAGPLARLLGEGVQGLGEERLVGLAGNKDLVRRADAFVKGTQVDMFLRGG